MQNYTIIYIHGLNGTKNGSKVTALRNKYGNDNEVICLEWDQKDNIGQVIKQQVEKLDRSKKVILLGSSSGGKILFLTLEIMKELDFKYEPACILLNPLNKLKYRIEKVNNSIYNPFLLSDDLDFKSLQKATIIYSLEDEVIDQENSIQEYHTLNTYKKVQDHHGLHNSMDIIFNSIEEFIKD